MNRKEQLSLELLKKKIVDRMRLSYPGLNPDISEWRGQEITDFQEELLKAVNAHISEKWFYTHMKSSHTSLPRIDILNLLSRYAGYSNWDDFVFMNREHLPPEFASVAVDEKSGKARFLPANKYFLTVPLLALAAIGLFILLFLLFNTREYRFCFYDADTKEMITKSGIEVILLSEGESPVNLRCGEDGCVLLKTDKSLIRMVVRSQYYHTDTITRIVKKLGREERVGLRPNDYAMMIHYFSMKKTGDWELRREKLEKIIAEDAMICQVMGGQDAGGLELFTRQEFIDRLTMPSGSLKNIEILDTRYHNDKISVLRFRVKGMEK